MGAATGAEVGGVGAKVVRAASVGGGVGGGVGVDVIGELVGAGVGLDEGAGVVKADPPHMHGQLLATT